jgi:hypothetical protein
MDITQFYDFTKGLAVISPQKLQKYTENLDSYSRTFDTIYSSISNNKHAIDSCWETGYIYYANYDTGYVKKIQYDCTELCSIKLVHPVCLSIIQGSLSMRQIVQTPLQEDSGCWIADQGAGKIIKTDKNLNILYEYSPVIYPVDIAADIDGGCLVVDDAQEKILKISSTGVLLDSITYNQLYPPISGSCNSLKEIKPFLPYALPTSDSLSESSSSETIDDLVSSSSSSEKNIVSRFWFMAEERVYQLYFRNNKITQTNVIYPLLGHPSSYTLASIDVDLNDDAFYLYVGMGNDTESAISKYYWFTNLAKTETFLNMPFPYMLNVVQGCGATCFYVLPDISKWDPCLSSLSSTSSSTELETTSSSSSSSYYYYYINKHFIMEYNEVFE